MEKNNVKDFITEAFKYSSNLKTCSINLSVSRYLLEYIAYGFSLYGRDPNKFIDNVDEWLRMVIEIFPEIGFDHNTKQIIATIDLIDQVVIIDDELVESLSDIITIQEKYGLLIHYKSKTRNVDKTTTLLNFFEYIEDEYPVIKDRFKGLGSTDADVSEEIIMNPKTRRIIRVSINSADTMVKMGHLVGESKHNVAERKKLLLDFKYDMSMIDS